MQLPRRVLARKPRAHDLDRREAALDLPSPRTTRPHVEGGAAPLQDAEEGRPRGLERLEAGAAAELDRRAVRQRESSPRRGRVDCDERMPVAEVRVRRFFL